MIQGGDGGLMLTEPKYQRTPKGLLPIKVCHIIKHRPLQTTTAHSNKLIKIARGFGI